jgi:ZIP family zinc transporter
MEKFYVGNSALVEPIAAVLGAFAVTFSHNLPMLWLCGRCHDLCGGRKVIPETQQDNNTDMVFRWGFIVMMVLDVAPWVEYVFKLLMA